MAWVDNSNGYKQAFLRSSADGGKTFSESLSLNNANVNASNVDIYSNEKYVFIIWQQSSSPHSSIALQGSDDLIKSFDSKILLSEYSTNSYPKVFADEYTRPRMIRAPEKNMYEIETLV